MFQTMVPLRRLCFWQIGYFLLTDLLLSCNTFTVLAEQRLMEILLGQTDPLHFSV